MTFVQSDADRAAAFVALSDAVTCLLDRAQLHDAELARFVGPGTEAFRLLCLAEAAATGQPVAEVERERSRELIPAHHVRPLQHETDAQRIELLEEFLSEDVLREVDEDLDAWRQAYVDRRLARRSS